MNIWIVVAIIYAFGALVSWLLLFRGIGNAWEIVLTIFWPPAVVVGLIVA